MRRGYPVRSSPSRPASSRAPRPTHRRFPSSAARTPTDTPWPGTPGPRLGASLALRRRRNPSPKECKGWEVRGRRLSTSRRPADDDAAGVPVFVPKSLGKVGDVTLELALGDGELLHPRPAETRLRAAPSPLRHPA